MLLSSQCFTYRATITSAGFCYVFASTIFLLSIFLLCSVYLMLFFFFFFFQAEDGIRYLTVTGVQTCALPISRHHALLALRVSGPRLGLGLCRDRGPRADQSTPARPGDDFPAHAARRHRLSDRKSVV